MSAQVFRHTHRVTYAECAPGNHVYYARYLDLLEAARGEFFRRIGLTFQHWQEQDTLFPVVECRLHYRSPARYDDVLTVEVRTLAAEKVRLNFAYHVLNQSQATVLDAETFHVCTGLNEKPKRLPEELLARLQPYLSSAEGPA